MYIPGHIVDVSYHYVIHILETVCGTEDLKRVHATNFALSQEHRTNSEKEGIETFLVVLQSCVCNQAIDVEQHTQACSPSTRGVRCQTV